MELVRSFREDRPAFQRTVAGDWPEEHQTLFRSLQTMGVIADEDVATLDLYQLMSVAVHLNQAFLLRTRDRFEQSLLSLNDPGDDSPQYWENLLFVQVYLDVGMKLHNAANRIQATTGLRRPLSRNRMVVGADVVAMLTFDRSEDGATGYLSRLFYHDKTGRLSTPPSIIPLQSPWNEYMMLFLYATRHQLVAHRGFVFMSTHDHGKTVWLKNVSAEIMRTIRTETGLPLTLLRKQHALRDLFINTLTMRDHYSTSSLRHASVLVRNEVQVLQEYYAPWARYFQFDHRTVGRLQPLGPPRSRTRQHSRGAYKNTVAYPARPIPYRPCARVPRPVHRTSTSAGAAR